jgi:hypothetical protein
MEGSACPETIEHRLSYASSFGTLVRVKNTFGPVFRSPAALGAVCARAMTPETLRRRPRNR